MARIIHVSAGKEEAFDAISLSHVVGYDDKLIAIQLPYFTPGVGAQSVTLHMSRAEALELAARITNVVAHTEL
jgi:hypothetical protein